MPVAHVSGSAAREKRRVRGVSSCSSDTARRTGAAREWRGSSAAQRRRGIGRYRTVSDSLRRYRTNIGLWYRTVSDTLVSLACCPPEPLRLHCTAQPRNLAPCVCVCVWTCATPRSLPEASAAAALRCCTAHSNLRAPPSSRLAHRMDAREGTCSCAGRGRAAQRRGGKGREGRCEMTADRARSLGRVACCCCCCCCADGRRQGPQLRQAGRRLQDLLVERMRARNAWLS